MTAIRVFLCIILLFFFAATPAQQAAIDSLRAILEKSGQDTVRVNTLLELSNRLVRSSPSGSIAYAQQAVELSGNLNYLSGLALALKNIGMGYYFEGNYIETLYYWQQSLGTYEAMGDRLGVANILNNLGAVYFNEGDDAKAIEYYLESLRVSEEIGDTLRIATALVNIGAVYYNKKATHEQALEYYLKALPMSEALGDLDAIGTSAVNMGEIYLEKDEDTAALYYFEKALGAYRGSDSGNEAYAMNNIGKVYAKQGDFTKALRYQYDSYDLARSRNTRLEMAQSLLGIGETYHMQGDLQASVQVYRQAETIAREINARNELKFAYEGLADIYSKMADYSNAYKYQTLFSSIKDTLYDAETSKRIQAMSLNYEIDKKQGQIDLLEKDKALKELALQRQKTIRNAIALSGVLFLLLAGGLYNRYRYVRRTKQIIENEKDRSDKLLLNILPHETAEELKEKGSATPKHYDMVSVLFTDFKGFTTIAEKLSATELVEELNRCFFAFDQIIDKYGLEKIKTIGDAYMCAGGIPAPNATNPVDIVNAALEIKAFMENLRQEREARGQDYWELRIGIHTGPVVAGVVGKNKFAYDIWGDAVNTASRMESSGIPGKVNISGATYEFIKDHFDCIPRGKIQAKNKGEIDMYIVENGRYN
jgi:adenylate cyclase